LYTYIVCTWVGDQIIDRDLTGGLRTTEAEWYDKSEEDKVLEEHETKDRDEVKRREV
jgi:hypothetical protein